MRTLVIALCLLAVATLGLGQSLGDVAEQTKDQRKGQAPAKSYTDDDLQKTASERGTQGAAQPAKAAATPRPSPSATPAATSDSSTSDMSVLEAKIAKWQARYASVKARIDRLEKEVTALEDEKSRTMITFDPPSVNPGPRRLSDRTIEHSVDTRLKRARARLEQAQKELEDVMEQARQDGVASGQLY
jgi:hypothetical protein